MKSYKEMADAVFARRDEYVVLQRRKKKIALNTSLSLCAVCLAVVGAVSIWKTGIVEPDPNVLGTKPGYIADYTEDTSKHISNSNATSEGEGSEMTQITANTPDINGGFVPNASGGASAGTSSTDATSLTDPVEKVTKPTTNLPSVFPTLPMVPIVTTPTDPVVTDPVETTPQEDKPTFVPDYTPDTTPQTPPTTASAVTEPDYWEPDTQAPVETEATYWEPTTAAPCTEPDYPEDEPGEDAVPDEPQEEPVPEWTVTAPCVTEPCTEAPGMEEPTEPTAATEPPAAVPDEPEHENESTFSVSGKVYDQYGKPVANCEIWAYSRGKVVATTYTNSSGTFNFTSLSGVDYFVQYSAPAGYTPANYPLSFGGADFSANNLVFYCTKNES